MCDACVGTPVLCRAIHATPPILLPTALNLFAKSTDLSISSNANLTMAHWKASTTLRQHQSSTSFVFLFFILKPTQLPPQPTQLPFPVLRIHLLIRTHILLPPSSQHGVIVYLSNFQEATQSSCQRTATPTMTTAPSPLPPFPDEDGHDGVRADYHPCHYCNS